MLESSIVYIVARTFPESFVVILSGMILLNKEIKIRSILKSSIILGCIVGIIRILPINFGVHTILSMVTLGVLLYKRYENDIKKVILTTGTIWISLALSEGIYVLIATKIFSIPLENMMDNSTLKGALITLPSLGIMFIITLLLNKIIIKMLHKKEEYYD